MRRKKHKLTRRTVSFYKVRYHFHEPFKVLLDGNFIHAMLQSNLVDIFDHVQKLLGARVKLFTTKCITAELKSLGAPFSEAVRASRSQQLHKCDHEEAVPAAECLMTAIGSNNAEHWWVATQDRALRAKLAQIPGCPCLFVSVNGLHLEAAPEKAKSLAEKAEVEQRALPKHERSTVALKGLEERRPVLKGAAEFRKKKAKGPNPLAVRKKKQKVEQSAEPKFVPKSEDGQKRKRSRKKQRDAAPLAATSD